MIGRMRLSAAALACSLIVAASAQAQQQQQFQGPAATPPPAPPAAEEPPPSTRPGFFDAVGRWFGNSKAAVDSQLKSTQETIGTFGNRAKDAAGGVAAIPGTRVITGRERCPPASNGAPDCDRGVEALCRTKGFQSGRTLEVTSAHRCSVRGLISGRAQKEGPCPVETYVIRAVCQ